MLLVVLVVLGADTSSNPGVSAYATTQTRLIAALQDEIVAGRTIPRAWLDDVYSPQTPGLVWFDRDRPRSAVHVALRALRRASEQGLVAEDYAIEVLERSVAALAGDGATDETLARADVALTRAMLRYMSDVRFGVVRPQDVEPHYRAPAREPLFVKALRGAVWNNELGELLHSIEPGFAVYSRLKHLMARYSALPASSSTQLPSVSSRAGKVIVGDAYDGLPALHARLVELRDLAGNTPMPADGRYSHALAEGVRRFQERHGLQPDGVLGKETVAALNVPLSLRMKQIALSLERLRWLPDVGPGPIIAINIPSFKLLAFSDSVHGRTTTLTMPVIVGKAIRHETPMFLGEMRSVELSPYWNVPRNILRNELLPRLASDASLLAREDMEIVNTAGERITRVDGDTLASLRADSLRLRQRPGPRNALGGVKFVLPNAMDIYLHGTPAQQLFEQTRRDFSHGCIRVEQPVDLAQFVLGDQPQWNRAAIESAMRSGRPMSVKLRTPIPVVVFYTTAVVDEAGTARFLPDVYGHDRKLEDALRRVRHPRAGL